MSVVQVLAQSSDKLEWWQSVVIQVGRAPLTLPGSLATLVAAVILLLGAGRDKTKYKGLRRLGLVVGVIGAVWFASPFIAGLILANT
jgi:hypothetical protein